MFSQTEIIVLNYTKYSESSIIVHSLTKKHGRQSIIVYGIGGKRKNKLGFFQPLNLLETQLYYKPNSSLQKIKEFKLATPLFNIPHEIGKSALALFISEILYRSIKEEFADERLFDFVKTSILILEEITLGLPYFHVAFMVKLAKQLGFMSDEPILSGYYDYKENVATDLKPSHEYFLKKEDQNLLISLLERPYSELQNFNLTGNQRDKLLDSVVKLFELHLLNINSLRSYLVLKEVFSD
ncbi:MAG: DNA repair protein RecO [Salinivirgaceae bacterium]